MRGIGALLPTGIALLLAAPFVALTPFFIPPSGGCPPCQGFPNLTYPLVDVGIVLGVVGFASSTYGGLRLRRGREMVVGTFHGVSTGESILLVAIGVVLFALSGVLSGISLRGPGWVIGLYQLQGLYLEILGIGTLLFAGFAFITKRRLGAVCLATGIVLCGFSLLFTYTLSSDFSTRCFPDVGCSPVLANSTVSEMIDFGYLLAVGAFLLALGIANSWRSRFGK